MRTERRTPLRAVLGLAFWPASFLCVLMPVVLRCQSPAPAVNIGRIQVQPGIEVVKLILEGDGPLPAPVAYYPADSPRTLVVEIPGAKAAGTPSVPPSESGFMRDIQVWKLGQRDLRILVQLEDRVPVRIGTDAGRTVVEFVKVPRYRLDPEVRALIDGGPRSRISLDRIDVSKAPDRISFRARLSGRAVAQTFSLENPERLVVDLYDTVLAAETGLPTVDDPQGPVLKVRAGQFRMSDPRPITRLVFDLNGPAVYSLDLEKDGAVIAFYKDRPTAEAEVKGAPVPAPARAAAHQKDAQETIPAPVTAAQAAAPLIRKDLLVFGKGGISPPRRDIFRPRMYGQPMAPLVSPAGAPGPARLGPAAKAEPSFALELTYLGSVRSSGKITALILTGGQTISVVEGDEIIPGYRAVRVTADEIEVEGPGSLRKTFSRQGERP